MRQGGSILLPAGNFLSISQQSPSPNPWLTPVGIINVDKFLPLVMVDDADKSILQLRAQLKDKLIGGVNRKARCNEADMEGPTEGGQHVDSSPFIKPKDGVDSFGELGTDWRRREGLIEDAARKLADGSKTIPSTSSSIPTYHPSIHLSSGRLLIQPISPSILPTYQSNPTVHPFYLSVYPTQPSV